MGNKNGIEYTYATVRDSASVMRSPKALLLGVLT